MTMKMRAEAAEQASKECEEKTAGLVTENVTLREELKTLQSLLESSKKTI